VAKLDEDGWHVLGDMRDLHLDVTRGYTIRLKAGLRLFETSTGEVYVTATVYSEYSVGTKTFRCDGETCVEASLPDVPAGATVSASVPEPPGGPDAQSVAAVKELAVTLLLYTAPGIVVLLGTVVVAIRMLGKGRHAGAGRSRR
jgi:hypothetical protein